MADVTGKGETFFIVNRFGQRQTSETYTSFGEARRAKLALDNLDGNCIISRYRIVDSCGRERTISTELSLGRPVN